MGLHGKGKRFWAQKDLHGWAGPPEGAYVGDVDHTGGGLLEDADGGTLFGGQGRLLTHRYRLTLRPQEA